jgi:thioredoxin-like negative regulator of GroEL
MYVLQLATHYVLAGNHDQMSKTMKQLDDAKTYADGRLMAGDFYFLRLHEFENARQEYEGGLKELPDQKSVFKKRLVELYAATNRNNDANKLLDELQKEDPKDPDTIAMRSALRLTTGSAEDIALAATDLQSLVTKNPTNHLLRFNLAKALAAKGEVACNWWKLSNCAPILWPLATC